MSERDPIWTEGSLLAEITDYSELTNGEKDRLLQYQALHKKYMENDSFYRSQYGKDDDFSRQQRFNALNNNITLSLDLYKLLGTDEIKHVLELYYQGKFNTKEVADEENKADGVSEKEEQLFCRKCGAPLVADSIFCSKCGIRLIPEAPKKEVREVPLVQPVFQYTPSENRSSTGELREPPVSERTIRERNEAIIKRVAATRETEKRNKIIKISVILVIVAVVIILIVSSAIKSSRNAELRNFATETMNTDYTNVYADLVSMEPEYFVYTSYNNGAYNLSEIVCKCKTVEGKTIWIAVDVYEYPGGSSIEERNEPQYYSKSNPKRVVGRVRTSSQVMDELEDKIGNVFVLDVSEKITK